MSQDLVSLGLKLDQNSAVPEACEPAKDELNVGIAEQFRMLLTGFGRHAGDEESAEQAALQQKLADISRRFGKGTTVDELSTGVRDALEVIKEFWGKASGAARSQAAELQHMLQAMAETLAFVASSSDESVKQLQELEARLKNAASAQNAAQLRESLDQCLQLVRKESERLQNETQKKMSTLATEVDVLVRFLRNVRAEDQSDQVTGLPGRVEAEKAIQKKKRNGEELTIALFVMDRLATINGRFGRHIGDDILLSGARLIAQRLQGATLYRWDGPGLLGIFDASINPAVAETRAKQAASIRAEKNIDADGRAVIILITCTLFLQRMGAETVPEGIFQNLDSFLAAQCIGQ